MARGLGARVDVDGETGVVLPRGTGVSAGCVVEGPAVAAWAVVGGGGGVSGLAGVVDVVVVDDVAAAVAAGVDGVAAGAGRLKSCERPTSL